MRSIAAALGVLLILSACAGEGEGPRESLLREKDREFIRQGVEGMEQDVRFVLFTREGDCEYCDLTREFLEDVVSLSPRLSLEVLSLEEDGERAASLGVDKAPATAILGGEDYGIRYYGLPTGYEFVTFAETIRKVADGDPGLLDETVAALETLGHPVMITVFSTKS